MHTCMRACVCAREAWIILISIRCTMSRLKCTFTLHVEWKFAYITAEMQMSYSFCCCCCCCCCCCNCVVIYHLLCLGSYSQQVGQAWQSQRTRAGHRKEICEFVCEAVRPSLTLCVGSHDMCTYIECALCLPYFLEWTIVRALRDCPTKSALCDCLTERVLCVTVSLKECFV